MGVLRSAEDVPACPDSPLAQENLLQPVLQRCSCGQLHESNHLLDNPGAQRPWSFSQGRGALRVVGSVFATPAVLFTSLLLILHIAEEFFGQGWFQPFCLINLWGVTALIALIEILALNSIKRQVVCVSLLAFGVLFLTQNSLSQATSFLSCLCCRATLAGLRSVIPSRVNIPSFGWIERRWVTRRLSLHTVPGLWAWVRHVSNPLLALADADWMADRREHNRFHIDVRAHWHA